MWPCTDAPPISASFPVPADLFAFWLPPQSVHKGENEGCWRGMKGEPERRGKKSTRTPFTPQLSRLTSHPLPPFARLLLECFKEEDEQELPEDTLHDLNPKPTTGHRRAGPRPQACLLPDAADPLDRGYFLDSGPSPPILPTLQAHTPPHAPHTFTITRSPHPVVRTTLAPRSI